MIAQKGCKTGRNSAPRGALLLLPDLSLFPTPNGQKRAKLASLVLKEANLPLKGPDLTLVS